MHHTHACALRGHYQFLRRSIRLEFHGPCLLLPEIILNCLHIKHVTLRSIQVCDIPKGRPTAVGCSDDYSALPLVLESVELSSCVPCHKPSSQRPNEYLRLFASSQTPGRDSSRRRYLAPRGVSMLLAASTLEVLDLAWGGYVASNVIYFETT